MRQMIKRGLRLVQLLSGAVFLLISGCVVVPYPVSNETTQVEDVEIPDEVLVTVGPRKIIEEVSEHVVKHNPNIELVDSLEFRDVAFPSGDWSLQELMKPENRTRVAEQLDMQYLVLLTAAHVEEGESEGFLIPFLGAMAVPEDSTLSAFIIDLRQGSVVSRLNTRSSGKGRMLYYVIIIVAADPMTESAVISGLGKSIAETLAVESPAERLRIAILAAETQEYSEGEYPEVILPSKEELERQQKMEEKRRFSKAKLNKEVGTYCPRADAGDADAQKHIGDLFYYGSHGIRRDPVLAYVWYRLAEMGENKEVVGKIKLLVDEFSTQQADAAVRRLINWEPGQCEHHINNATLEEGG